MPAPTDPSVNVPPAPAIKVTRSMIAGATDEELQKLKDQIKDTDSEVAGFVNEEVQARQQPVQAFGLFDKPEADPAENFDPNLFPVVDAPVKTSPTVNASTNYLVNNLIEQSSGDPDIDYDTIIGQDKQSQQVDTYAQATQALNDESLDPAARAQKATELVNKPVAPKTLGEVFVQARFPKLDQNIATQVASELDVTVKDAENKEAIARILSDDPNQTFDEVISQPINFMPTLDELLGTVGKGIDKIKKDNNITLGDKNFREKTTKQMQDRAIGAATAIGDTAIRGLSERPDGTTKFNNIKEFAQFINPVEYEDSMDVPTWEAFKQLATTGTLNEDFSKAMENNYGPEWKLRWAAFLTKEVGVDATILALAALYPPLAAQMFAGKGASLATKAKAVLARASAVGVGGASVQSIINKLSGDDPNFVGELPIRILGELGGEALVKGVKVAFKGIKSVISTSTEKIANKAGLKVLTPEDAKKVIDNGQYKSPTAAVMVKAAVHQYSKEFLQLQEKVAAAISEGSQDAASAARMQAIQKEVFELTGIPPERQATELALGHRIYKESTFEHIGEVEWRQQIEANALKRQGELDAMDKKLEALKADKAKAEKRYAARPVNTAKGQAQRDARLAELDSQINALSLQRNTFAPHVNALQEKVKEGQRLYLTTGNQLADRIIMGEAFGFRTMGESLTRQKGVNDLIVTHTIGDQGQFRPYDINDGTKLSRLNPFRYTPAVKEWLRLDEPDRLPLGGLAKDFFDAVNRSVKIGKTMNRSMELAVKGLDIKAQARVYSVLEEGAQAEKVFSNEELILRGLTPDEADSYYAIRKTLDFGQMLMDDVMVKEFKAKGIMSYQGRPVNVLDQPDTVLTADKIKAGFVRIREVSQTASEQPIDKLVSRAELTEVKSAIPHIPGYLPIIYKNANYHVSVINVKEGTVGRVAAFKRQSEAIEYAKKRDATAKPGEVVVYNSWNSVTSTGSVGFTRGGLRTFQLGTDEIMDGVKQELTKLGVSEDRIRIVMDKLDLTSMRRDYVGARAKQRLDGVEGKSQAELVESPEAITEYLAHVAQVAGVGNWRTHAIDGFKKSFPEEVFDKNRPWFSREFIKDDNTLPLHMRQQAADAKRMQRFLLRSITNKTKHEKYLENAMDRIANNLLTNGSAGSRALGKVFERLPYPSTIFQYGRGLATTAKLLTFNLAQLFVQGSQTLGVMGAHPVYAAQAMQDMLKLAGTRVAKNFGARGLKDGDQIYFAMEKSGWINLVDNIDLMDIITHKYNPAVSAWRKISSAPFVLGEATNRTMAFLVTRREFMDKAAKGTLMNLNGKKFTGKIDDDEFIRLVTNKAKIFALNMGRAGQLELLSGAGAWLGQFKQVIFKAMNVFETTELSGREKFGAAAAMIGLFGPTAIPLLPDLFKAGDEVGWQLSGTFDHTREPTDKEALTWAVDRARNYTIDFVTQYTPEALQEMGLTREFYDRLTKKGAINALTKGEWDVTNRVALGMFFHEMSENLGPEDMVVSIGVLADLVDAANKTGIVEALNPFMYMHVLANMHDGKTFEQVWRDLYPDTGFIIDAIRGERTIANAASNTATEFGQAFSYVGTFNRFVSNVFKEETSIDFRAGNQDEKKLISTSMYRNLPVEATNSRLGQYLLGFTPGAVVEQMNVEKLATEYENAMIQYRKDQLARFDYETREGRRRIVEETIQELINAQHLLSKRGVDAGLANNFIKSTAKMFMDRLVRQQNPEGAIN